MGFKRLVTRLTVAEVRYSSYPNKFRSDILEGNKDVALKFNS